MGPFLLKERKLPRSQRERSLTPLTAKRGEGFQEELVPMNGTHFTLKNGFQDSLASERVGE